MDKKTYQEELSKIRDAEWEISRKIIIESDWEKLFPDNDKLDNTKSKEKYK